MSWITLTSLVLFFIILRIEVRLFFSQSMLLEVWKES
jgi:hypothetical protein